MDVLRGHFRTEFINRIDEIIVFHALGQGEIRSIVELQLERVRRTAQGQGVDLVTDPVSSITSRRQASARNSARASCGA